MEDYENLRTSLGIYYLCHGPREGDPNNEKTLENVYLPKLMRIISIMPRLKMRLLTMHLWLDPRFVKSTMIRFKVDMLKRILLTAEDSNITVCLENMSENAEHLSPVFQALPSLRLTLDVGHAQLLTDTNTSFGFIEKFPERIAHIHLHDNLGGTSPAHDLHLPVGRGTVDFPRILDKLFQSGYEGTMTLELKPEEIRENLGDLKQILQDAGFRI